jgi:hypothetical protein
MLVALADVDRDDPVFEAGFLEHYADLFTVAGRPEKQVNQEKFPCVA